MNIEKNNIKKIKIKYLNIENNITKNTKTN